MSEQEKKILVQIPRSAFNEVYLPYLFDQSRYLVFYGGAGSGKSFFIVQRYLIKLLQEKSCNLLVVRKVAETNRQSTFALFKQVISQWGLDRLFKINESYLKIRCLPNGNEACFSGLDNVEKLKSITFSSGVLTDIWMEEASEATQGDFNQLDIRLRGGKTQKQIVVSFNPIFVNHWLKGKFFDRPPKNATVLKTTYVDNRFLDEDYKRLLESYRDTDPYYYDVYCKGRWGVAGNCIFYGQGINRMLEKDIQPVKTGEFCYQDGGNALSKIQWVESETGMIKIYQMPVAGRPYVIGGDTAGDGSDFFVAQVLDNTTGKQVAVLRHRMDEDQYAKQIYCLGRFYNTALIGIECNFSTYPIRELERLRYENQYVREVEDNYTHPLLSAFGFRTTSATRPVILAGLVQIMRESPELVCDQETLNEMLTFVRNERGRAEAAQGAHDDCVMALAIAHYIRPQQEMADQPKTGKRAVWTEDMYQDYENADDSGKQYLIQKWGNPF